MTLRERQRTPVAALGFYAAVACFTLSLAYVIAQLGEWLGMLGSAGGPSSRSTATGIVWLLTPSLLLAPTFVVMTSALSAAAPLERSVFGRVAVAFATIYAALVTTVYFAQLTWVMPRMVAGRAAGTEPFAFEPFDSFLYSVDILGYSFMSAATVFAALALPRDGPTRTARRYLLANGAVLPFLVLQMYVHEAIWPASMWAITFPGASWALAAYFRRLASPSFLPRERPGADRGERP